MNRVQKKYGSSSNTSRKRPQQMPEFERLAESAKRRKPIEAPSSKSDDEEGITMNGRSGLRNRKPAVKTNNPPEPIDLSSDDDQRTSPHFKPRNFNNPEENKKNYENNVHAATGSVNSLEKQRSTKGKRSSLVSRRGRPPLSKSWELSAFQHGTRQFDSQDGGSPIKLVITTEYDSVHKTKCDIKVVRDEDEWPIPHESILSVSVSFFPCFRAVFLPLTEASTVLHPLD
jgi:hypothetical protein